MQSQEWTFPSSSNNATYTTKRHADGSLSCNCKGWTFKRGDAPRECKHTREVAARFDAPARTPFSAKPAPAAPARTPSAAKPARTVPAPMLASAMTIPATGAAFDRAYRGWLMEEKHDGHRVGIAIDAGGAITAWSRPRAGEEANARELPASMLEALAHFSPGIYDGEIVVPGGNSWDVTAIGSRLVFVAFDLLEVDGVNLLGRSYEHRRDMLLDQLAKLPNGQKSVTTVESHPASWAKVEAIWKRGGEGAILKRPASAYRPGHRSPDWVKVKEQRSAVLTITGYEEGKCGPYSKLKLRDEHGIDTTVKTLVDWRGADGIPFVTLQACEKRLRSQCGATLHDAARLLDKPIAWVRERVLDGTVRVTRARWDRRRLYLTDPMIERLRRWKPKAKTLSRKWLFATEAEHETGVSVGTIVKWTRLGMPRRRTHLGFRYAQRSLRAWARRYWRNPRLHRATPPAWLQS